MAFHMAELIQSHAGSIKNGEARYTLPQFEVFGESSRSFICSWSSIKGIKFTERELGSIPWQMKDIVPEKLQM